MRYKLSGLFPAVCSLVTACCQRLFCFPARAFCLQICSHLVDVYMFFGNASLQYRPWSSGRISKSSAQLMLAAASRQTASWLAADATKVWSELQVLGLKSHRTAETIVLAFLLQHFRSRTYIDLSSATSSHLDRLTLSES